MVEEKFFYSVGYSDREPFEVVGAKGAAILVRAMKAEQIHKMDDLDPHPGGFCCHYANQRAQRWDIQPDPESVLVAIRLSAAKDPRKNGCWFDRHGNQYRPSEAPYKFHDYNF